MEKQIAIGQFKAQCLRLLEQVRVRRRGFTVTRHGRPIARVVPTAEKPSKRPHQSSLAGTILFEHDIVSPLDVPWEAMK